MSQTEEATRRLAMAENRIHLLRLEPQRTPAQEARLVELEAEVRELRRDTAEMTELPYRADTDK